jgi:hypothetical protein
MSVLLGVAYGAWTMNSLGRRGVVVSLIVFAIWGAIDTMVEIKFGEPIPGLVFNAIRGLF